MRKLLAPTLIMIVVLMLPAVVNFDQGVMKLSSDNINPSRSDAAITSSAGSSGTDAVTVLSMSRTITGLDFDVLNSYSDTTHTGDIDFTQYQVPGWSLYGVEIDATTIDSIAERKTLTLNPNDAITIRNNSGLVRDALYQEFYNQPHDGKLENYTFSYLANPYDISLGEAYLVVRSNYSDSATNVSSFITPFTQNTGYEPVMHDCSADNAVLSASTFYYVVIDGTAMVGNYIIPLDQWVFNQLLWRAEYPYEGLDTGYHLRGGIWDHYDSGEIREAELNYTYIPWNTTSNAALAYSDATQIGLTANATAQNGMSWFFTAADNIDTINFQSTLSINIGYDLTLKYKKTDTGSTTWQVINSGDLVQWNVTANLLFPTLSGTVINYLNFTIQADWNPTGLYNSTSSNYGHYSNISNIVYCTDMTNGLWILTNSADNYVTAIDLSDSSTGIPLFDKVSILVDVDVDVTVENGSSAQATTGSTNFTIWYGGSVIHAPPNESVSAGLASYVWDIDSIADNNGTHTLEIFWTDGVEAGYFTRDIFVFYPTTLDADDNAISAYTNNTFDIGIDFDQIYPVRGLDISLAKVNYTFGSTINEPMDDAGGGRWTKTVSTATMSNGTYDLIVYAEGFALENQSLLITVNLIHQTQTLNWSWSNTNDITYLDSTNLTVTYSMLNDTRISDATVNVTFQSQTYPMVWDSLTQTYWIELTGADFTAVPGTFALNVSAGGSGYDARYNSSITITIGSQTGEVFSVEYNPSTLNISYVESLFISVTYDYNSNPIDSNTVVRVLFNGSAPVDLVFNATSSKWETTLLGNNSLGAWNIIVRATADGYSTRENSTVFTVHEDTPSMTSFWAGVAGVSGSTQYGSDAVLQIIILDSSGAPLNGSGTTLTANVFGSDFLFTFNGNGTYSIFIDPQDNRGVQNVTVTISETGYVVSSILLDLTVIATTDVEILEYLSSEYEQWNLTITANFTDAVHGTPISNGNVTVTIDGVEYDLTYDDSGVYVREIVLDFEPENYTMTVVANGPFCNEASDTLPLEILAKSAVYLSVTTEGDPSLEGQRLEIIATLLNGTDHPVQNVVIQFVVTIYYVNGTIEVRDDSTQYDTTNNDGVASWGFDIPSGNIETISIQAEYVGSRVNWNTILTHDVSVGTNPLMLLLSFFFIDPVGQMLILSIVVLGIVATAYNKRIKPKKRAARASLENQLKMFRDLESLRHFMAVYLDRGTCVFYHPFTDERIQPDLISGFIAAITSVYGEIKGDGVRGTLEEIQYHGLRLNSYSGEFTIGILILEGEMTPLLKERLQFFVELFENQYDSELTDWNGLIDCFDPEWIVSTLSSAFNYSWLFAHRFGPTQKVGKTDARILDYISAVRDDRSEFHFRNLLAPLAEMLDITEAEVLDRLLVLQDRGVIAPVSIQTILQRQGMGLANGEIGAGTQLELPEKEEPKVEESTPAEEPDKVEELVYDDDSLVEEKEEEKKEELDPMDAFVKDVESILTKEKEDESEES